MTFGGGKIAVHHGRR